LYQQIATGVMANQTKQTKTFLARKTAKVKQGQI
jgi:hypothetical protein